MAYCTEAQVRNSDKKLENTNDVTQVTIEDRISQAEKVIKVDLSSVVSEDDLDTIGATSNTVNLLATYKAVELSLVAYYGVSRKVDELTDVQYFKKEYEKLRDQVLNGTITITVAAREYTPKSFPKADSNSNKQFYRRKGMPGFVGFEESADSDETYSDDSPL